MIVGGGRGARTDERYYDVDEERFLTEAAALAE